MEDAHTTMLKLGETGASFFGVFDGHGGKKKIIIRVIIFNMPTFLYDDFIGSTVAQYTGQTLHKKVLESEHFAKKDYGLALKEAFLALDKSLIEGKK